MRSAGKTAADLNSNTIVVNNNSPIYSPPQGYQGSPAQYGGNSNMGGQYGGPSGPNMYMNTSPNQGGNARVQF